MKLSLLLALIFAPLLPLAALGESAASAARERVYFGVVAFDGDSEPGLLVSAVAPASPAYKAGIRGGDRVLRMGQVPINSRSELLGVVAKATHGEALAVEIRRAEQRFVLNVVLERRPASAAHPPHAEAALGADRRIHPIDVSDEIRKEIRRHRRLLREELASLPDGLVPSFVTDELNAIRNLARDAHAHRPGWMSGRAGEISVRFRDDEGSVVLYGANNLVSLEIYNAEGELVVRYDLNTEAERSSLPEPLLRRLQRLRR